MDPLDAVKLWDLIAKSAQVGAVIGGIIASIILVSVAFRKAFSLIKFFEVGNTNGNGNGNGKKDERILDLRFEKVQQITDAHEERLDRNEESIRALHRRIDRITGRHRGEDSR